MTYHVSTRSDSQTFTEISELWGDRLQCFSDAQKRQILSNLADALAPEHFDPLPDRFYELTGKLSERGKLSLLMAIMSQLE